MKSIILIFTCFFLSFTSDVYAFDIYETTAKLVRIDVKPSSKSITYHFEFDGKKKQLTYSFLKNNNVRLTFGKGANQQSVTIKAKGELVFKSGAQTLNFTKNQRKALFAKLNPNFAELVKKNYLNSNLGLQMVKDKNIPQAQGFVEDLPLVKLINKVIDLANGDDDCEEEMSCSCMGDKNDTVTCPCGAIVRCEEINTVVCYYDSNGTTENCEISRSCTAICFVPQSRN